MREMLQVATSAVVGNIIEKTTWHGPLRGLENGADFTTLTVEGDDLVTGKQVKHQVTYIGTDAAPLTHMPAESDSKVGNRIVIFSKALDFEWGGRSGLNSLIAAEGGIFRIESGPKGDVVLGRGNGTAIGKNTFVSDLRTQVAAELAEIRKAKK
jgi:hypothetical protein